VSCDIAEARAAFPQANSAPALRNLVLSTDAACARDGKTAHMATTLKIRPEVPDLVQKWRLEQLEAAGYPQHHAVLISQRADIDLHAAVRLLDAGCPLETALRILL
jgi:hypothetical protein